jgi:hypothetical protein
MNWHINLPSHVRSWPDFALGLRSNRRSAISFSRASSRAPASWRIACIRASSARALEIRAAADLAHGMAHQVPHNIAAPRAKSIICLATSPEVGGINSKNFYKCRATTSSPAAQDDQAAAFLRERSAKLAGIPP